MATLFLKYKGLPADPSKYGEGYTLNSLSSKEFEQFNPDLLGLGDVSTDGTYNNVLVAFIDLQGFTDFCNQPESHLVLPEFLTKYLKWLFDTIAKNFKEGDYDDHVKIWGNLPFYAKFLGDGILFMWNTDNCGGFSGITNIIIKLLELNRAYVHEFYPYIVNCVSKPPKLIRCGISRGQVISIGNGEDFVGPCINFASRLQKVSLLTFTISRRGFDLEKVKGHLVEELFSLKKYPIRGVGSEELLYVLKSEFENLPPEEKAIFVDI